MDIKIIEHTKTKSSSILFTVWSVLCSSNFYLHEYSCKSSVKSKRSSGVSKHPNKMCFSAGAYSHTPHIYNFQLKNRRIASNSGAIWVKLKEWEVLLSQRSLFFHFLSRIYMKMCKKHTLPRCKNLMWLHFLIFTYKIFVILMYFEITFF